MNGDYSDFWCRLYLYPNGMVAFKNRVADLESYIVYFDW